MTGVVAWACHGIAAVALLVAGTGAAVLRGGDQASEDHSPSEMNVVNEELGGSRWRLFPPGKVPGWQAPDGFGGEIYKVFTDEDLRGPLGDVARMCKVWDTKNHRLINVRRPEVVTFLVDPKAPNRKDIVMIVVPGGGWRYEAWEKEGKGVADWLMSIGVSAFVLKYRVPTPGPKEALPDLQRAVSFVRNAIAWGTINASRVGVIGFSAGGYLTTELANSGERLYEYVDELDMRDWRPDFQMIIYGGPPKMPYGNRPPPTFMAHAEDDPCVPASGSLKYCKDIERLYDQRCERYSYTSGGHGFGVCKDITGRRPPACDWMKRAEEFLEKQALLASLK